MNAWIFINLIWSMILLLWNIALYLTSRGIEEQQHEIRKFYQWNEKQERKQRQL